MKNKDNDKYTIKMLVHPNEKWVIDKWRKQYRFGTIEIKINEGVPVLIEKVRIKELPPK